MRSVVARSARTPLFKSLQRLFRLACLSNQPGAAPADELLESVQLKRRDFLRVGVAAGVLASTGCTTDSILRSAPSRHEPRIVIVGAGIAGLNAAYTLRKAGVRAEIYEAANRAGGRIHSATDLLAPGLVTELGGEFIDSGHEDMLALVKEFGLGLLDREAPSEKKLRTAYFFGGKHRSERQIVEAFRPLAARIAKDADSLEEVIDYRNSGNAATLDKLSLAKYLDRIGAQGWIRDFLRVAYVTEFGLDENDQSALNLITLISTDLSAGKLQVFGDSDERYKVEGGNSRIIDKLTQHMDGQIHFGQRLEAIRQRGAGYVLSFQSPNQTLHDVRADLVVLTLPFSVLRDVRLTLDLPPVKRKAIQELGYGTNAKILIGTTQRVWRNKSYTGEVFSDLPFQLAWDNTQGQAGATGGLTLYSGGKAGMDVNQGPVEQQVERLMAGMERVFPGISATRNGKVARYHWPSAPLSKGSYACYRPGQWTSIGGAEFEPVDNLYFAGEHCSSDFQGFMNGGAETGRRAAETLLTVLNKPRVT